MFLLVFVAVGKILDGLHRELLHRKQTSAQIATLMLYLLFPVIRLCTFPTCYRRPTLKVPTNHRLPEDVFPSVPKAKGNSISRTNQARALKF